MRRLPTSIICLMVVLSGLLGLYEITAKSEKMLGNPLPGWQRTRHVENHTPWNPPTGFFPLDKLLHESEEALRYYGFFG
ncbi:MAG: hypothetical protein GY780_00775 [bacterium]|nr:hypothetical protein [bacterium]